MGSTWSCPQSRDHRPVVASSRYATSALASPEEMNLKEVFGYWNNILLLNSSERFPSCCLSNVKVLLLALSLNKHEVSSIKVYI